MTITINETKFEIGKELLDFKQIDAFIHPTNNFLWFSGAYQRLKEIGGEQLETEATQKGPIDVKQAMICRGGRLNAKYIIHIAAWKQDLIPHKANIREALLAGIDLAVKHQCRSIALPIIGAELAGFSFSTAIDITFMTLVEFCMKSSEISDVILLATSHKEEQLLLRLFKSVTSIDPEKS